MCVDGTHVFRMLLVVNMDEPFAHIIILRPKSEVGLNNLSISYQNPDLKQPD